MQFNIISDLKESSDINKIYSYNQVIAYNLCKALREAKQTVNLVHHSCDQIPQADSTIVISRVGFLKAQSSSQYRYLLRQATRRKLCLWLDSDFGDWQRVFDRVLCVNIRSRKNPSLFRWVGWAADSEIFRSEQKDLCAVFDPYMYSFYGEKHNKLYDEMKKVRVQLQCDSVQPVEQYNKGRLCWLEIAALFRRASHYVLTQPNYWGWTNIEAATCGALLVVHKTLDVPETWPTKLCHVIYESSSQLQRILESEVDVQKNRQVALKNNWHNVVLRVLENV